VNKKVTYIYLYYIFEPVFCNKMTTFEKHTNITSIHELKRIAKEKADLE